MVIMHVSMVMMNLMIMVNRVMMRMNMLVKILMMEANTVMIRRRLHGFVGFV